MVTIPTLETERLVLRAFRADDFESHAAMVGDPLVMRYIGEGKALGRDEAWRVLAVLAGHWQLRGFGMWAVTLRGEDRMIGRAGFYYPEGWPGFEIGWTLERAAWGQGYATEAARRALAYAFDELGREKVISVIHPENATSIRVAERIGERFDRTHPIRGEERLIYSVTRRGRRD